MGVVEKNQQRIGDGITLFEIKLVFFAVDDRNQPAVTCDPLRLRELRM